MNGRQRVFGAMRGEKTDRRPFTALLSLYGAGLTRCPLEKYYTDASAYACGQAAVGETFGPDILFAPFALAVLGEAFGSKVRYFDNQPPNMIRPAILSSENIPDLVVPDVGDHPRLTYIRESLRALKKAHGGHAAVVASLLSPVDLPLMIMGIDGWMETVLFDGDGIKRMLDITVPFFLAYAEALVEDGADLLLLPSSFLTPTIATRQIVEKFTLPVLHDVFSRVRAPILVHHAGSPFLNFLELFAGLPNVAGFVLDHRDDMSAARCKSGSKAMLMGSLDGPNLGKSSPAEIEARCRELLEAQKDDPCFILGTCGPDVALDAPAQNIHAMRRAVEGFKNASET